MKRIIKIPYSFGGPENDCGGYLYTEVTGLDIPERNPDIEFVEIEIEVKEVKIKFKEG